VGSKPALSLGKSQVLFFSLDIGYLDRGFCTLPSVKVEPPILSRQLPSISFQIRYQLIIPPFGNTRRYIEGVFIKNKYANKYIV